MVKVCMLSTGHGPLDDRIYYKETLSLLKKYFPITFVMPKDSSIIEDRRINYRPLRSVNSLVSRFLIIPESIFKIIKIRPDICHFHDYELIFAIPFLKLFSKCKIVYDVHEAYPDMVFQSQKIPRMLRKLFALFVDQSEKILSIFSDYIVTTDDNIAARFKKPYYRVSTIFNYPRLSLFKPDKSRIATLRKQFKNRTLIVYCGSMGEDKGLFQMLRAMAILKESKPNILLLLIGGLPSQLKERVRIEINRLGVGNVVSLIGQIPHEDIVNYLSISKVGLIANLPTKKWHKNIPIKQFEYMACGVPVLGSDLPPIASYIISVGCGKVFDPISIQALASGVLDILQDESEWNRMAEAGRKAVGNFWNWEKMEEKLLNLYEEILQGSADIDTHSHT